MPVTSPPTHEMEQRLFSSTLVGGLLLLDSRIMHNYLTDSHKNGQKGDTWAKEETALDNDTLRLGLLLWLGGEQVIPLSEVVLPGICLTVAANGIMVTPRVVNGYNWSLS